MRTATIIAAAALALGAGAVQASSQPGRGEAELSKALEGRVAGTPVDCLRLHDIRSTEIISDTAILYTTSNDTIYVNRPRSGAKTLDKWDVLVTDTHSTQLCSIDVVRLYDTGLRMQTGFVGLGAFVPYRKPAHD